ncbi:hypothetical protein NQ314_005953 [Rhamnusium bicolor]|uniref:PiggyBac transposable element-derived protein domain-containing protein n=1 Tax=Rhamnusium bicolor TaxID=1586634 RepID=A0AAV8ZCM2_9CUCU|nr:hypothetical protein NQ314_005953 [Rhamnusium bicolor]
MMDNRRPLTEAELLREADDAYISSYESGESEFSSHETDSEIEETDTEEQEDEHFDQSNVEEDHRDTENETDDENTDRNKQYFFKKNKYKWSKIPPASGKTRVENKIRSKIPAVIGEAYRNKPSKPVDSWNLLFDEHMLDIVVEHTNERITEMAAFYGDQALSCQFTNHIEKTELKAFIGLLLLSGAFKSHNEDVSSLWATNLTGCDIFRVTMTLKRFCFLCSALRFDDSSTRADRIQNGDKLAPISELFNLMIVNSQSNYSCGEYMTIDEMLVGFRGRCRYKMYMPNKPNKYGLKIMCLCDAKTHYLLNAFIYAGKDTSPNPRKLAVPTLNVLQLVQPIINSNRNITGDNWFSSIELVNELKKCGLTYTGTLRKNKRKYPLSFYLIMIAQLYQQCLALQKISLFCLTCPRNVNLL